MLLSLFDSTEMAAVGSPPSSLFLDWPGIDQATHDMLLVHQAHANAQLRQTGLSSSSTPPMSLLVSTSPTEMSPPIPFVSHSDLVAGTDILANPGSLASLEERLSEASAQPPRLEMPELYTPYASDSDASSAASSSTSSFDGEGRVGGRYANWRRPSSSRKRRSEDLSSGQLPVTIRTQSWGSEAGSVGATTPLVLGGPNGVDWATPFGEAGTDRSTPVAAPCHSSGVSPRATRASPPPKRRKSVTEAAVRPSKGQTPRSALDVSRNHPSPALARSLSEPGQAAVNDPAASVSRSSPFSVTGMPKPPRLRSVSAYVPPATAQSELQSIPTVPFTLAPATTNSATPPGGRPATTLGSSAALSPIATEPCLSRSAPGSVSGAPLAKASKSRRASRAPRIPGSLSAAAGSSSLDAGLNPVVEVNTEWVPIRPRIRTAIRRKLEQRRADVSRVEHVLEDSRPPPVVPAVEKAAKKQAKAKGRRGGKARSSSSASELESSDATTGSKRSSTRAKAGGRRPRRGKASSQSAPSSDQEDGDSDDEEEAGKPFEHGPTELPPRRTCRVKADAPGLTMLLIITCSLQPGRAKAHSTSRARRRFRGARWRRCVADG